LFSKPLTNSP